MTESTTKYRPGVLAHGTEDEVRLDVEKHIRRLGRGGGYICGSSHNIHEEVSTANFLALVEAIHEIKIDTPGIHRLLQGVPDQPPSSLMPAYKLLRTFVL